MSGCGKPGDSRRDGGSHPAEGSWAASPAPSPVPPARPARGQQGAGVAVAGRPHHPTPSAPGRPSGGDLGRYRNPDRRGTRRARQLSFCHLILVQQSTVNNNLNALVVSHCSFFVNVTRFINKSKPADPGFSETWMLLLKLYEANSQTHDLYYLSTAQEMIEYTI